MHSNRRTERYDSKYCYKRIQLAASSWTGAFERLSSNGVIRALGVKKRFVKFSCIEYHIYHDETGSKFDSDLRKHNIALRESNAANGVIRIKNGIDQFLEKE